MAEPRRRRHHKRNAPRVEGVAKSESTLLILFIPSVDRHMNEINQGYWETSSLELLGARFGGATAFPRGRGVWRDDKQGGRLVFDPPIVGHCYTSPEAARENHEAFRASLVRLGTRTN